MKKGKKRGAKRVKDTPEKLAHLQARATFERRRLERAHRCHRQLETTTTMPWRNAAKPPPATRGSESNGRERETLQQPTCSPQVGQNHLQLHRQ